MSQNHKPAPRQDRRGIGRSVVKPHAGQHSVGTKKPTILDEDNGDPFGDDGSGSAPGANGPAETED
jgi:hypothetical protein